jgi:hypothetical protein
MNRLSFILIGILIIYLIPNSFVTRNFFSIAFSQSSSSESTLPPQSVTKPWTTGASSPTPKMESAYASVGDKIYIIAGYGETGKRNKNSLEIYDSKTNTWSTAAPVPVNLNHAAAASYNGKIYVAGGIP